MPVVKKLFLSVALFFVLALSARGDAMLQLFNLSWNEVSEKLPEIAEAGYTSLWLPPPTKRSEEHTSELSHG